MRKEVVYSILIISLLIAFFVVIKFEPSITSASVKEQPVCVSIEKAPELIENGNCTVIDDAGLCTGNDLVEIRCP